MDKKLQDLAWSILPKEFKEEVRELYDGCIKMMDIRPSASEIYANKLTTLEYLFGIHNLTSDAEGEEMLTISRKEVQEQYRMYRNMGMIKRLDALMRLFGPKCLPDEACNVASNVASTEP